MKLRIIKKYKNGHYVYDVERKIAYIWWSTSNDRYFMSLADAEIYARNRLMEHKKSQEKKTVVREFDAGDLVIDKLKGVQ